MTSATLAGALVAMILGLAGLGGGLITVGIGWIFHRPGVMRSGGIAMGVSAVLALMCGFFVYRAKERGSSLLEGFARPAEIENMRVWFEVTAGYKPPPGARILDGRDAMPDGFFIRFEAVPELTRGFEPLTSEEASRKLVVPIQVQEFWRASTNSNQFYQRISENGQWKCYLAVDSAGKIAHFAAFPAAR